MNKTLTACGLAAIAASGAMAQQAAPQAPAAPARPAPRRTTVVVAPAPTDANGAAQPAFTVSLSVRGPEAASYLSVKANNADIRDLFKEMGQKSATPVLLASSVSGRVTIDLQNEPLDSAMAAVAKEANLPLRRILVPAGTEGSLTPDSAGRLSETLTSLPASITMADPASGKMISIAKSASVTPQAGQTVVYYLQGRMTPEQERIARERRVVDEANAAATRNGTIDPRQTDVVAATVQSLSRLPVQQRMEAMRNMQRQMFQNMTPQEQQQMRNAQRGNRRDRMQRNR